MTEQSTTAQPNRYDKLLGRIVFFISIGVLGNLYFSWQATDTETLKGLTQFSPWWLAFALGLLILMWIFNATRLYIWSKFLEVNAPFINLFRISMATDLGAAVTPTIIGGAPIKVGMMTQTGFRVGVATTLVALSGVEDICFFLIIIPVSLTLTNRWESPIVINAWQHLQQNLPTLLLILGGIILFTFALRWLTQRDFFPFLKKIKIPFWKIVRYKLAQIKADFKAVFKLIRTRGRIAFALSVLATAGQWLSRFGVLVALVLALNIQDNLLELFTLQWMVFLSMSFIPTPGATGGAEVIFYYVFKSMLPAGLIGIIVASWRFLTYYFMMLLALLLLQITKPFVQEVERKDLPAS